MRPRSELRVPIRDRRQRRRILTLKNFGKAMLVTVGLVTGILIEEHLRNRGPESEDYGRLYSSQIESTTAVPKKPEVVTGTDVPDQSAADPMLVQPAAREQLLMAATNVPQPQPTDVTATATDTTQTAISAPGGGEVRIGESRMVVVGGPEGVSIVKQSGSKPVLGGGFGRQ